MSHVPLPCIPWCLSSSISTRHSECRSNKSHQRCPSYDGCLVRLTLRPHHWPPMPRAPVECSRPTAGTTTAARRLMCPTSVRSSSTASVAWCRRSSSRDPRSGRACRGACWRHRSTSYDTIEVPGLARCCWLVWLVGWLVGWLVQFAYRQHHDDRACKYVETRAGVSVHTCEYRSRSRSIVTVASHNT